jgi:ABC-type nitrate/sulfonate/bicarbonate transport system ATPase subunit
MNPAPPIVEQAASEVLLTTSGLTVSRGRTEVVHDVDLTISRGDVVAILGPNGSGKSTLLAGLAGLLPCTRGSVTRHGRVAIALQAGPLARRSVLANVELGLAWWGVPMSERRTRAIEALRSMGASHLAGRSVTELSGGERRRVHLARVLATRPDVLLLDEPFVALDAGSRDSLLDEAGSVVRSHAGAVAVVVHDRTEAWALADRIVILLDGRVAADGAPAALLETPPSEEVARFLGFTGEIVDGPDRILTRPSHAVLDPAGPYAGRVIRSTGREGGARLEVELPNGRVQVLVEGDAPAIGADVRLRLVGGARFPVPAPDLS